MQFDVYFVENLFVIINIFLCAFSTCFFLVFFALQSII